MATNDKRTRQPSPVSTIGLGRGAEIGWSTDFVVIEASAPFSKLLDELVKGRSRYIVIVRETYLQYAFLRSELKVHPEIARRLWARGIAMYYMDRSIQEILRLHEWDASGIGKETQGTPPPNPRAAGPRPSEPSQRAAMPSAYRRVQTDDQFRATRVGEDALRRLGTGLGERTAGAALGTRSEPTASATPSPPREPTSDESPLDEGTAPRRFPSIKPDGPVRAGAPIAITVDLRLRQDDLETQAAAGVAFEGLEPEWTEIGVGVELQSAGIEFDAPTGTITVRRNAASVPCTFKGKVSPAVRAEKPVTVFATFSYAGRTAGFARRDLSVGVTAAAVPPTASAFVVDLGASAPALTVRIFQLESTKPGRLTWSLAVARDRDVPNLPGKLHDVINLGRDTKSYAASLYRRLTETRPGEHLGKFRGVGQILWRRAPPCFRDAYWAMRRALGEAFSIQFVTNDPYVPWELMRPYVEGGETAEVLAMVHPIGRWIADYEGNLRGRLTMGRIVTIAPEYPRASDVLKRAQEEKRMLVNEYRAEPIEGKRKPVEKFLQDGLPVGPVSVIHFAGHGEFDADLAGASKIRLEDGSLTADEVGTQEVKLGERDGPFVVFNACELGATGAVLGAVGGWAEVFLRRKFRGFIAPLWPVDDKEAAATVRELFQALFKERLPLGEALRDVRKRHGAESPTYFAYLLYGDVMARFE